MNSQQAESRDDLLARLMADYDDALATNASTTRIDESVADLDPQLAANWEEEKQWLELLDRARRSGSRAVLAQTDRSNQAPQARASTPQRLGRFIIERELGRGGLGIVYLARDPQLGRMVALKVPRFEAILADDLRHRFLREAEAAARLNHPNVVALHEVGEEGAICYLASEYCSGPTLAEWLRARERPVPYREAAELTHTLAEAVQHAHSRGVLHRDIKPSNVMMSTSEGGSNGGRGTPKLTDFGMAKLLEQNGGDKTRTGAIIGTLAYMAPEQAEGRVDELDSRTDVYGLGAILYELLAGAPPYCGQTDIDTLRQLIAAEPVAPRKLRPDVPRDLEAIALKCIARNPATRYQTAADLARDLNRFLAGEPTAARPSGWMERTIKWSRRHPAACAVLAVSTLALVLLSAGGWVATARLRAALNLAEERRRQAQESEAAAATSDLASRRLLYASELSRANTAWESNEPQLARQILENQIPKAGQPDLREFAWRCLWTRAHEEEHILRGHTSDVFCVRYSPDGNLLASASKDHDVCLWDAASGTLLAKLSGHTNEVVSLEFLPGGRQLVSVGEDGKLLLWNVDSRQLERELYQDQHELYTLAVSADGRFLATAGLGQDVRVFRTENWHPLPIIVGTWKSVHALQLSADGSLLFTASDDGPIRVWRTGTGQLVGVLNGHPSCVRGLALFDRDQRLVSVGREDGTVCLWNLPRFDNAQQPISVEPARAMPSRDTWLQAVTVGPDKHSAFVAARDGSIVQINLETAAIERSLHGHEGRVWSVCVSPDRESLATAGADCSVRVWPLRQGRAHEPFNLTIPVAAAYFRPDNSLAAVGSDLHRGAVVDVRSNNVIQELTMPYRLRGDFDGDGLQDDCEFTGGQWTIRYAGENRDRDLTLRLGTVEDEPLVGDWDGDGKSDLAMYRDRAIRLYCDPDTTTPTHTMMIAEIPERLVVGDWNGDGADEIGYFTAQGLQLDSNLSGGPAEWRQAYEDAPLERLTSDSRRSAADFLDHSFGNRGRAEQFIPDAEVLPCCLALQTDEKVIVAGRIMSQRFGTGMFTARVTVDGKLDESFGPGGVVVYPRSLAASAVLVQPDGRIVVTGNRDGVAGGWIGTVVRYLDDGQIDSSFIAPEETELTGNYQSIALQPDGKLLLAGGVQDNQQRNGMAVYRVHADTGRPDESFGDQGRCVLTLGNEANARHLAVQADRKILVAGYQREGQQQRMTVVRLDSLGKLDRTFGESGVSVLNTGSNNSIAYRLSLLPNGQILVNGEIGWKEGSEFALMRLMPDGTIDPEFGRESARAKIPAPLPGVNTHQRRIELSKALGVTRSGRILIGGHDDYAPMIANYDPDGNLEACFSEPFFVSPCGSTSGYVMDATYLPDGHFVAVAQHDASSSGHTASLFRFLSEPREVDDGSPALRAAWQKAPQRETENAVVAVAQSDGVWAAGFHKHGVVRTGSLSDSGVNTTIGPLGFEIESVALSDSGRWLAITSNRGAMQIWDVMTNTRIASLDAENGPMPPPQFSPDGTLIAFCQQPGRISIWDYLHADPRPVEQTTIEDCNVFCFSPDGQNLATINSVQAIKFWDVATGKQLATIPGQRSKAFCIACSPDGRTLVTGGDDHSITLWDLATNQKLYDLRGQVSSVRGLFFQPDGQALVSVGDEGELHMWSAENPPPFALPPH